MSTNSLFYPAGCPVLLPEHHILLKLYMSNNMNNRTGPIWSAGVKKCEDYLNSFCKCHMFFYMSGWQNARTTTNKTSMAFICPTFIVNQISLHSQPTPLIPPSSFKVLCKFMLKKYFSISQKVLSDNLVITFWGDTYRK